MSIRTVYLLLKMELTSKGGFYLLITIVSFAILLFYFFNYNFSFLSVVDSISGRRMPYFTNQDGVMDYSTSKFHLTWFPQIFLLTTSVFTSVAFSEFQSRSSNIFHLSLPANMLEKWISKVLIVFIILPICFILLYQLFALLTYRWDNQLPFNIVRLDLGDPFQWQHIKRIIILQGIVLFGATFFKKYAFFKILLTVAIVYLSFNLVQIISLSIFREDINLLSEGGFPGINNLNNSLLLTRNRIQPEEYANVFSFYGIKQNVFFYLLSIGCLFLSYLRFRESEA